MNGCPKKSRTDRLPLPSRPTLNSYFPLYSQNGMTDSDSRTWVMLRIGRPAEQSHKRKESVYGEIKVCRFGCPCRDDCSRSSRARRRGKGAGENTESRRVDSETGKETGACGAVAVLL